ncbi:hypothetical protein [Streptomyces sp. WAC08401]|uniref:hypothetical protein n=1 Tax=Streptomyces sp. WAC08401 TaxID=2487413 RepID=UPI00163CAEB0|nr:hypothetical protein [Streptomyces sp. WAC08401]
MPLVTVLSTPMTVLAWRRVPVPSRGVAVTSATTARYRFTMVCSIERYRSVTRSTVCCASRSTDCAFGHLGHDVEDHQRPGLTQGVHDSLRRAVELLHSGELGLGPPRRVEPLGQLADDDPE